LVKDTFEGRESEKAKIDKGNHSSNVYAEWLKTKKLDTTGRKIGATQEVAEEHT